jgi:small conductance mechanosensitive channel
VEAKDDPVAGMQAGLDAIRTLDFILQDPEPDALIKTVGDSNIVLTFYGWIDQQQTNFSKARSLAIRQAMRALDEQGFTLPEPIYRLRFDPEINAALFGSLEAKHNGVKTSASLNDNNAPCAAVVEPGDSILDVSPDKNLQQKVDAEIRSEQGNDLLNENVPHE